MSDLRTAAQQALEALEAMQSYAAAERKGLRICDEAIPALKAALAEPVQEPKGYFSINDYGRWEENESEYGTPLYTVPPQRKPLRFVTYVCPVCAASLERQE